MRISDWSSDVCSSDLGMQELAGFLPVSGPVDPVLIGPGLFVRQYDARKRLQEVRIPELPTLDNDHRRFGEIIVVRLIAQPGPERRPQRLGLFLAVALAEH